MLSNSGSLSPRHGVVAIPADAITEVLAPAEALAAKEVQIRSELAGGLALADALKKFGHV
jgi:regulator of RNase E activity RraA